MSTDLCPFSHTQIFHSYHNNLISLCKKFKKFPPSKGQLACWSTCSRGCSGLHAYTLRLATYLLSMGCRVSFPLFLIGNNNFTFSLLSTLRTSTHIIYEIAPICHTTGLEMVQRKACSRTAQYDKFLFHKIFFLRKLMIILHFHHKYC